MKLYLNVTIIFCIWALAVFTIFYFGFLSIPHSGLFPNDFVKSLANWDGGHYLGIADGYDEKFQYAFFPFYPLLINFVSKLTGSVLTAGILISIVSSFLAINLFYQLIILEFGKQNGERGLLAILFFPMSFYLLTVYSEALFLLLSIATFLFVRKKNLFLATVAASLAGATRFTGLAVVFSLFVHLYVTRQLTLKNWFVFLAPLGFLIYCIYLYVHTGDPLYFIRAENYWNRSLVIPGSAIVHSLKELVFSGLLIKNFSGLLDLLFTVFGIALVWKVWRSLGIDYAIYSGVSLALPLFSPTLLAIPRYLLTIFPIFMVMTLYKNKFVLLAYQIFSLILLAAYAILFIGGYGVT